MLFDLDGTLVEADFANHPSWAKLLKPFGHDVDWDFYQERISGRLNPDIVTNASVRTSSPSCTPWASKTPSKR